MLLVFHFQSQSDCLSLIKGTFLGLTIWPHLYMCVPPSPLYSHVPEQPHPPPLPKDIHVVLL